MILAGIPAAASGAPPWSAPVDLSTPGRQAPSDPVTAVSPEGLAVVAWWRRDAAPAPGRDVVQVRLRATRNAPFVGPTTLSRLADDIAARPGAAAAAGRIGLVGWTERTHAVALRVLPRTGSAVPVARLAEGAAVRLTDLDLGVAPSGAAVAVWARDPFPVNGGSGGDRTVRIAVRAPGGAWSAAGDLSPAGGAHPQVAVAPDGSGVVAWERDGALEVSLVTPQGAVTPPAVLSAPGTAARLPGVAVNAAGDAVVAWYQDDEVLTAERTAGGAFGAPRAVSPAGGLPDATNLGAPSVGLAADGRTVAAWRRRAGGHLRIEAAIRPAGRGWDPPVLLSPTASRNAGRPSLGMDAAGHAVVAWSQPSGISLSAIRARTLARTAPAFGALEAVSAPRGRGTAPSVALDGGGRSVLAWREDPLGGRGRLFRAAVRLSPG